MKIQNGRVKKPFIIMVHGTQGVGKSTWAASLDNPLFIGPENTEEIVTSRAEKMETMKQLREQLSWISKENHEYKTLVIDAIDGIEQIAIQEIINSDKKTQHKSLNKVHGGYGAGTDMLIKEMLDLRDTLQSIRDDKGMNICVVCHTKTKNTVDPVAGAVYDEFKLSLNDKTENIWLDWVSAVLFMTDLVSKPDDEKFAYGEGEKIIYTQRRPGSVAKNRYNLPYELQMPLSNPSGPFMEYFDKFFSEVGRTSEEVIENIRALVANNITDKTMVENIETAISEAKNVKKLEAIEKKVNTRIGG